MAQGAKHDKPTDRGYFPPGESVLREVHGERIVGLYYGQRTSLIGALDPLLYESTARHTHGKTRPFARLSRTANIMERIFFGTQAEADAELARIGKMHSRVEGQMPKDSHPDLAGKRYAADQPRLAYRTIGSMADSALAVYERYVRGLSADEREDFWQDYLRLGELFGMRPGDAPATFGEFRSDWDSWIEEEASLITDGARESGYQTCFKQPLPAPLSTVHERANYLIVVGTLPRRVRELYGLHWGLAERTAGDALALYLRTGRMVTPRFLRRGYNKELFDLVAATERRRQQAGRPTWQMQ